jgi:predicted AAA+ superfamily ATPase
VSEFKRITNYIFDNIGKQTSANKIANYLQSNNKSTTTDKTVDRYIKWMIDANLIYRSDYFNLKGKKVLETSGRYFSIDVGIRNISAKFNLDRGYSLENLVFCEFKRLGCNLYGYKFHDGREIDFIVESKNGKLRKFIQVTEKITSSNQNAEIGNLLLCKEPYERIVISRYDKSDYTVEGVRIVNMIN